MEVQFKFVDIFVSMLEFINSLWALFFNNIVGVLLELLAPRCFTYLLCDVLIRKSDVGRARSKEIIQNIYKNGRVSKKQFDKLESRINDRYKI